MKLFKAGFLLGVGLLVIGFCSLAVHASYQCLELNGSGYASIADGSQTGLDMGLSDFMMEIRIKLNVPVASQTYGYPYLIDKTGLVAGISYNFFLYKASEALWWQLFDGSNTVIAKCSSSYLDDLQWHSLTLVVDKSSATGLEIYIDGSEVSYVSQDDPSAIGNLDNDGVFYLSDYGYGTNYLEASLDELRVWNFGVDGLPTDYATYIAWRALKQNAFSATSEYDSDSWASYVTNNLSAYYKFSGNYTDETSNNNDLTAGGSGNTFPTYTLKKRRIISPASVN